MSTVPIHASASSPASPEAPARIRMMGVELSAVSMAQTLDYIAASIRCGQGGWVVTPNLDIFRRLSVDQEFASLCKGATLLLADGMPLIWASRLRGTPLPERVPGSDLIFTLTARAAHEGFSVYLLGGNPGTAEAAARSLQEKSPSLRIAGTRCPPMGFERDAGYMSSLIEELRATSPNVVYVALGCPKQEHLIVRMRESLPSAWFLGIGVTFSFVSGEIRRAPLWMQRCGLEWVHRLAQEPGRLAKRYLVHGIPFAFRLLARSVLDRADAPSRSTPRTSTRRDAQVGVSSAGSGMNGPP